ncbi:MAG TPA: cysteine hydrolase [Pseudonocardia sp.]
MEHAFGLDIPRTLEEACHPARTALVIYDMQVGVVRQIADGAAITRRTVDLVAAARAGGYRVIYTRHMFPPPAMSGVAALRTAMAWQRVDSVADVRPFLTRDAPGFELVPELAPSPDELVLDKMTMSAFEGTPLDIVLRDCRLDSFVIAGVAMEVGIEPTVRHALDVGYLPIVVADACGAGHPDAAARSRATLEFAGGSLWTETAIIRALLTESGARSR